jgi:hypothetical protein
MVCRQLEFVVDVALPGPAQAFSATSPPTFTETSGEYQLRMTVAFVLRAGFLTGNIITVVGDVTVYYPGASRERAVSLKIESNETILVGIDFAVP